jgi:2',3'-cyclic-nucleotide 2'-phosphodiesterase / 3'-nucleotidase
VKKIFFIFLLFVPLLVIAQNSQKLIILHTTDVHGNIRPYDYFRDVPSDNGLAKVYTKVKEFRIKYKNVLLLDTGDLIQGTPMIYYFNRVEYNLPNPMIFTMNYMRYDAFAVGNHDIEQGYMTYDKALREADFPWLSANGVRQDGSTFFEPYTIIEKNGIRIGMIGLTTPAIPMWLDKSLYPGISWDDMVSSAKKWVEIVRPQVDVLIGMFHAGMNAEYSKKFTDALNLPNENASSLVAENVSVFDVILCGHSHRRYPDSDDPKKIGNALMLMSGSHARYLGVAELSLSKVSSGWKIDESTSQILSMDSVETATEILDLTESYHTQTLTYIRQQIGTASDTISGRNSRDQDNAMVELINKAQMAETGAGISFAASFNQRFLLNPGQITIKDIYGMYRYENFLYTIEMTGKQIKNYLEFCAEYFTYNPETKQVGINNKMAGYNFDMAEGISYEIHVKNEPGNRIKNLTDLSNGQNLDPQKTYAVAMNSYRASGGGGHLAACGISQATITWKSSEEMRNILANYIQAQKTISARVDNNWRLVID